MPELEKNILIYKGNIKQITYSEKKIELKKLFLTLGDAERLIKVMTYHGQGRDSYDSVEYGKEFPLFVQFFYENIFDGILLNDMEFFNAFLKKHFKTNGNFCTQINTGINYPKDGIMGRALRTYPSLLRDLHFYLLCANMNIFDEVGYSLKADTLGYDLVVKQKGVKFGVALFVNTKKASFWKEKKEKRHGKYPVNKEICITINPYIEGRDKIALYEEKHVQYLAEQIQKFFI